MPIFAKKLKIQGHKHFSEYFQTATALKHRNSMRISTLYFKKPKKKYLHLHPMSEKQRQLDFSGDTEKNSQ